MSKEQDAFDLFYIAWMPNECREMKMCLNNSFSKRFEFHSNAFSKLWNNTIFETVILQWVVLAGRVMKMPEQFQENSREDQSQE